MKCTHGIQSLLKTFKLAAIFLLTLSAVLTGRAGSSTSGLTVDIHLYQQVYGYFFFPYLNTNDLAPSFPDGDYLIASPQYPTNGSSLSYHASAGTISEIGGGGYTYPTLDEAMAGITNGTWSIWVTNSTSTNHYTFTVSAAGIDENFFPLGAANVIFPIDVSFNNSTRFNTNMPNFMWSGPTNWTGQLIVNDNFVDTNGTSFFEEGDILPNSATNWLSPITLPDGTNSFSVLYTRAGLTNFTSTTPLLDNALTPLSGWATTGSMESSYDTIYNIGTAPVTDTILGHVLLAHYTFDDTNNIGNDISGNNNYIGCGTSWDTNGHVSTAQAKVGGEAMQFFGNSSMNLCNKPFIDVTNALSGSFSISFWINTTNIAGSDGDDLGDSGGQNIIYQNHNNHSSIPFGITGTKGAFETGSPGGSRNTLHTTQSVTTGSYVHIVVTRDEVTGLKSIYVNGSLDASDFGVAGPLGGSPDYLSIGGFVFTGYMGLIDDVQFYAGVLRSNDVAFLYQNPGISSPDIPGNGLQAHFDFDEGIVAAVDVSRTGNNIVLADSFFSGEVSLTSPPDTKIGPGALNFDGVSFLSPSTNLLGVIAGDFTISLWLNTTQDNGDPDDFAFNGQGIIAADVPGGARDLVPMALTGGEIAFNTGNGNSDSTLNSVGLVNDGNWHHVVVTRDQSSGLKQIYIDGQFDSSQTDVTGLLSDPQMLAIGCQFDASIADPEAPSFTGGGGYQGLLDDIQFYGRVLAADEINSLFANPGSTIPDVGGTHPPDFNMALNTTGLPWTSSGNSVWFVESATTLDGVLAAQSGPLNGNQTSTLSTTINGPATLSFYWQVHSSDFNLDGEFDLDGNFYTSIGGNQNWRQVSNLVLSPGQHTLAWIAQNDGSTDTNAALFLDEVTVSPFYPPFISNGPFNNTVTAGTTVTMSADVTANPPASLQWLKNSKSVPGATNLSLTITNAQIVDSGNYQLFASNTQGTAESFVGFLRVYVPTDLQPLSVSVPPLITSSALTTIIWTVTNTGPGSVSNFYDELDFSPAVVTHDFSQGSLGAFFVTTPTGPASTYTVTNTQRFANIPAGTYQMVLNVDSQNLIIETNETNNSLPTSTFTVINPDMQPGNLQITSTFVGGSTLQFSYDITNNGPGILDGANWTDSIRLSKSAVLDTNAFEIREVGQNPHLAVGQSSRSTNFVNLPVVPSGDYYLFVKVDAFGFEDVGNVYEANESNNVISIPIHIIEPDLVPTNIVVPAIVSSGQPVAPTWMIQNQGDGVATNLAPFSFVQWYDPLYISTNQVLDGSALQLGVLFETTYSPENFQWETALQPGQTMTNSQPMDIPNLPQGSYYIILNADALNLVREGNESNNIFVTPITVLNPDLNPVQFTGPPQANAHSTFSLTWGVTNQGAGAAYPVHNFSGTRQWVDRVYVSSNSIFSTNSAVLLGEFAQTNVIAAGTNYLMTNSVTLPGLAAGNYFMFLLTDAANELYESNESNNIISYSMAVDSPDLAAANLIVPPVVSSQQPFSPVYAIKNLSGVTALPGWSDRIYFSTDGILETNNIPLGNGAGTDFFQTTALAVGNTYTNIVNPQVPAVAAGNYFILLQADGNQFFSEPSLANNLLAQPIQVLNPDLAATNFNVPISVTVTTINQHVEADWNVINQGPGTAYQSWSDIIYLSPTNVLDTNAIQVGGSGSPVVPLAPGQNYLNFCNVNIPNGIQGNFYLLLVANAGNSLYESKYTNNILVRPFQIIIPPLPKMQLTSVTSPTDAWSGQNILVTWTLTNSGNAPVEGPFFDQVYLATSAAGDGLTFYGNFPFNGTINPGESVVRQQTIALPINLSGTFWVEVQNDVNQQIFQFTNRPNEILLTTQPMVVHLTPTPNLTLPLVEGPTNTFSSAQVQVSWVVTNNGVGPTRSPYWSDSIYLSASTNLNDPVYFTFLGSLQNGSFLNPGDSYASSLNVGIPRGLDGTYYFLVTADSGNNVFETNKTDNTVASAPVFIQLTPTPDLQTASVSPPHSGFSGQPVTVQWAVTNRGLGQVSPTENAWFDRVYVSSNNFLNGSEIQVGTFLHAGALEPDQGYVATNTMNLPIGISGQYYFLVECDAFNNVFEGAFEDNNVTAATFTTQVALTPPPDLVATILQAPTAALASHPLFITYSVENDGSTITPNTSWSDTLYISTNPVFNLNNAQVINIVGHGGALLPGAGYTNTISVPLPDGISGTYYAFVYSDVYKQVFELNQSNNLAIPAQPITVLSKPADLTVNSFVTPPVANLAGAMLVSWTVTNIGVGDTAVSGWNDTIILSQNTVLGAPSDLVLANVSHQGLLDTNGTYSVLNEVVPIPNTVGPGNYNLFIVANDNGAVYEGTNTANNVFGPVPITITSHSADLKVVTASGPANAFSGTTVNIPYTLQNNGDLPPNNSYWLDAVYLSTDGSVTEDSLFLGYTANNSTLLPGASTNRFISATIPLSAVGDYYFVVVADYADYVSEPGLKGNNTYVVIPPVHITKGLVPDLAVTNIIAPTVAYEGQPITLTWTVTNLGTATAFGPWIDAAYLSLDQILDPSADVYLGFANSTSNSLAPGQSYTNTFSFTIPEGLSGPFYVFISTDFRHSINELGQTDNNVLDAPQAVQIQLLPPVDLVAGPVTVPVNGSPGQNLTITYSVHNQGANAALGTWQDSLYISSDTNWDVGDALFAKVQHTGDIAPGASYTNTVTASVPGVLPGDYYVIVRSDILNHLIETNKTNNIAASLNSVSMDVPKLTLGTPASGAISTGQSAYYKFDATNGDTIHVKFSTPIQQADNELFVKQGSLPTTGTFDSAANDPFVASPEMFIPITNTGPYYLLITSGYMPTNSSYTVLAEVLPFSVETVQPNFAGIPAQTTFKIQGALFATNTQFQLVNGTDTVVAVSTTLVDTSDVYATFNIGLVSLGLYDLQAVQTVGTNQAVVTLSNAVTIMQGVGPVQDVSLDGPLEVNPLSTIPVTVFYGNSGDADEPPFLVLVEGQEGTILGTARNELSTNSVQILARNLVGPTNLLRPQISDSDLVYYSGGGLHIQAVAISSDNDRALSDADWQEIETSARPEGIADANWVPFWSNIRNRIGPTWGDYVQFLDRISLQFPSEVRHVRQMIGSIYTNQPGFQASASLSGVLLGSADNLPKPGMEIGLYSTTANASSGSLGGRATTDNNGQFFFPTLAPGTYFCFITNSQFDMNQDGAADVTGPTFTITSDLSKQTLYLFQPPSPLNPTNDTSASLVRDSQNVLHMLWFRNTALWHAWSSNGVWVDAGIISTNTTVDSIAVGSGAKLLDGSSPGLIAVWSARTTNNIQLMYSVIQHGANGGYEWSEPVTLTTNSVEHLSPAVKVRADGTALITYLELGSGGDDTDVYYSAVNIASGALEWSSPAGNWPEITPQGFNVTGTSNTITIAADQKLSYDVGGIMVGFGMGFSAQGQVGTCTAGLTGTANVIGTVDTPKIGFSAGGTFTEGFEWQINPDKCDWEFKKATMSVGANLHVDIKGVVPLVLRALPDPSGISQLAGTGLDSMTLFLARWNVILENSIGFGVGVQLDNIAWTHDPPPVPEFREPDTFGRALVTLDANLKIGARHGGKSAEITTETVDGMEVATTNKEAVASDKFPSASGEVKVSATFGVYPKFYLKNINLMGTFKVSIPPLFSVTYSPGSNLVEYGPAIVPGGFSVAPRDGSDQLPPGWTFGYDTAGFTGTTNVYGANAVLASVASDLYQDGAPALANDASGTTYQAWYKYLDPTLSHAGSQIYVADYNGSSWNAPVVIPNSLGINSYVSTVNDVSGRRMVVWVYADSSTLSNGTTLAQFDAVRKSADLYYSTFDGASWSTPQPVAVTAGADNDVDLSTLVNGNLMAVWTYVDSNQAKHLVSSQWNGASWSLPDEIAVGAISDPVSQQIAGTTHILWTQEVDVNHDTSLFESLNGGSGWSKPSLFSPAILPAFANPSVLPSAAPRILDINLSALSSVTSQRHDACCKCEHKLTTMQLGPKQNCGIESHEYDYDKCLSIFTYKACPKRARDPNDITGPIGFGPDHWVSANLPLSYTVDFANDPSNATAPAKVVTITVPLDPGLDPRKVRLGSFGFGGLIFTPPTNSAFYSTTLDFTATNGFLLDVFAGVDVANKQAFWTFTTLDPNTGDVPLNPLLGFLPPDTAPPNGEGFISFSVMPQANVPTGTKVGELASVVFDNQPPLNTLTIFNSLEAGTPTSSVVPLPATTINPVFNVSWQGVSIPGGDGIGAFDIYVSQDGGGFGPWLLNTTLNTAPYVGQPGSTYGFYSIAHANSGNIQPTPSQANTSILVSSNLPPVISQITNVTIAPGKLVTLQAHATDPNGDALTFSLNPSAPTGAQISSNGFFRWRTSTAFSEAVTPITVIVTDNGVPPMSTNTTFSVSVSDFLQVSLGSTNVEVGQSVNVPIILASSGQVANVSFSVQVPENILTNLTLSGNAAQLATATLQDNITNIVLTFSTLPGQMITGTQQVSQLNFTAASLNQLSSIISLPITNITAMKPGGTVYTNYLSQAGSVVVVQNEPLLQAIVLGNQRDLILYGRVGTNYELQSTADLTTPNWQPVMDFTQTNSVITIPVGSNAPVIYYRVQQK